MAKMTEEKLKGIIKKRMDYFDSKYTNAKDLQKKDFDFYRSEQWDETRKRDWKSAGLPTFVNNRVKGKINLLKGQQAQNRLYFKVIPNDDMDTQTPVRYDGKPMPLANVCQIITNDLKKIENENDGEYELSDCFGEGIICGKSYVEPFIEEDQSMFPSRKVIKFESRSYNECYPDPDAKKYDLSDAQDWIKYTEISREKLKEMFPDVKESIIDGLVPDVKNKETEGTVYKEKYTNPTDEEQVKGEATPLLLVEYYYSEPVKRLYLGATGLGIQEIPLESEQNVQAMYERRRQAYQNQGQEFEFKIFPKVNLKWKVASYCSGEILDIQDTVIDEIGVVQYCADYVKSIDDMEKRIIGVVRDIKDPQDAYNRFDNLTAAHLASSVHSGIVAEENVVSDEDIPKWKKHLSQPGFFGKVKKGAIDKWRQLFPQTIDQGFFTLGKDKANEMDEISNIRPPQLGQNKKDQSGKALAMVLNQGYMGTHFYFDNFRRTKHLLCRKLVKMICFLKEVDYNLLKIVIDDAVESPTTRYANQVETQELLANEGAALMSPFGDLIIQGTNLTNKDKWLERWQQVNEFNQWKQEQEMKAEAEKLAIQDSSKDLGLSVRDVTKVMQ